MIDYEQLHLLAGRLAVPTAVRLFPDGGDAAIRAVYRACKRAFATIEPFQLGGSVIVFSKALLSSADLLSSGTNVMNINEVRAYVSTGFTLSVDSTSDSLQIWSGQPMSVEQLGSIGVVFHHDYGNEKFHIAGEEVSLPRVYAGQQSYFTIPTYANLDDALAYYKTPLVQNSSCHILSSIWYDDNRLFLVEKPENRIQYSLQTFLRYTLRSDAEVMREQNVDDSHPVDIRVTFHFKNNVALIEVKWLGKSKHSDGTLATGYSASRAVEGAHQLAKYLDHFAISSPFSVVRGYLVVLDARRRGLDAGTTSISEANGMYYAHQEIVFNPRYEDERRDFSQPLRMFAEPICS